MKPRVFAREHLFRCVVCLVSLRRLFLFVLRFVSSCLAFFCGFLIFVPFCCFRACFFCLVPGVTITIITITVTVTVITVTVIVTVTITTTDHVRDEDGLGDGHEHSGEGGGHSLEGAGRAAWRRRRCGACLGLVGEWRVVG